jgi:DNA-binding transcriptional LysR family regulator
MPDASSDASQTRGWAFRIDGEVQYLRPRGRLDCSDGQVLHEWCLQGLGIAWRSTWEVQADLAAGRLVSVLDDFAAPPNGIYAVFPAPATWRCGCGCGSTSSSTATATPPTGAGAERAGGLRFPCG